MQIRAFTVIQPCTKLVEGNWSLQGGLQNHSSAMKLGASAIWHFCFHWRHHRRAGMDGTTENTGRNHKDFSVGTDGLCELTTRQTHVVQSDSEQAQIGGKCFPHVAGTATLDG